MDESSGSAHEFEELSKAIAEAVMNSKKVRKIVAVRKALWYLY